MMYRSLLDTVIPSLEFDFDPLRPAHAHDGSTLEWPEYPFKQVVIDRLCGKYMVAPRLSIEAAAGALLLARGDLARAVFEVDQHLQQDAPTEAEAETDGAGNLGWMALQTRFRQERDAFRAAKREFLRQEKQKIAAKLQAIDERRKDEAKQLELQRWKMRQIIKRYEDGSKYDGEGINKDSVLIPHGHGTLWVPQDASLTGGMSGMKRVPKYIGAWADGFMHGAGCYYWGNDASWEGHFCRNELQGKGVYTCSNEEEEGDENDDRMDSSRGGPKIQRVRYYDASQHVCWGDELVMGRHIRIFDNRLYGDPMSSVVRRHNVDLEVETECVIVRYDSVKDQYLVREGGTEDTRWLSLCNTNFRLVPTRPIARLEAVEAALPV